MAITLNQLAQTISTRYEVIFRNKYNQSVNVDMAKFKPMVMNVDVPDFTGNRVSLNWLGASPQLQEWVDEKQGKDILNYDWEVVVKRWEASMDVDMDAFKDARWNIYEPRIREMAKNASRHTYVLLSDLMQAGETGLCYDGQGFFDTDHSEGASGTQSNELTGTGTTLAQVTTDYYTAKSALMGFKDDVGEVMHPTDFRPLIWIPNSPTLIERFNNLKLAGVLSQTSNILVNDFDIVVDPRFTDLTDWYMFRNDTELKSFINVNREEFHYEDNFGSGTDDVFKRRVGMVSVVGRDNMTYGMWQCAVKVKNA